MQRNVFPLLQLYMRWLSELTNKQLDGQLLQSVAERIDKQILHLNSSILENESRLVIATQAMFLLKDVLMLEEVMPFSFEERTFSDMRRHLHFVDYYNQRENYEMMLHNANDLIYDFKVIKPQILDYARAISEGSKEIKKTIRAPMIGDIVNVVTEKLRSIIRKIPKHEREIQDALETLFLIKEYDFEREKVKFEYSTKSYQPDFTFESLNLAVDAKLCNSENDEKDIIDQINADIVGYRTKFDNLLFLVYDIGCIRDAMKLSQGIEKHNVNVWVRVIKH